MFVNVFPTLLPNSHVGVDDDAEEKDEATSGAKDKQGWTGDDKKMTTYTMQANKRTHCQRLASFIRLCDYIVANMLHNFAVKSVDTLLAKLREQVSKSVDIVDLVSPVKVTESGEEVEEDVPIPRIPTDVTSPRVGTTDAVFVCMYVHVVQSSVHNVQNVYVLHRHTINEYIRMYVCAQWL